jgi:thiopurine S-methyltransferase
MEHDFWHRRWQKNQIGFHEGAPNALLTAHFAKLGVPAGGRVLVPLCGKSHDMLWLRAQGYQVVGAELSRTAVEQFFAEHDLTPAITPAGFFERFEAEGITILVGDIFELDDRTLGPVDAVHDRAALVALPDPMRKRYAAYLPELTNRAPQFLVTFIYDQSVIDGPPFSVSDAWVRNHYEPFYDLSIAETRDVAGGLKGICPAQETAWLLKRC